MKLATWNLKVTQNEILKRAFITLLVAYSILSTICVLKMKPEPIIIAVESTGTRIVTSSSDRALQSERESFLRRFIGLLYTFDSASFDERVSLAGDLMSGTLWKSKKPDFLTLSSKMKESEVEQSSRLLDIREIDPEHYQADLIVKVKRRLEEVETKIRLDLSVHKIAREHTNPYDLEVTDYAETILH